MIDPASKLIYQGTLTTDYNSSKSEQQQQKRKHNNNNQTQTTQYSVLYLDGRLESYPGDPFSVGSVHEACKPTQILHLNPLDRWSLISIPSNSNATSYPFTLSRQSPSPARSQPTPLTHLGLDVEAMGYHPNEAHLLKAKDRMSLKQIFGFRPKRSVGAKNSDKIIHLIDPNPDQLSPLDAQLNSHYLSSGSPQAHPQSRHTSPGSNLSPHSSIHQNQNLPNSINFSTHSESARKQWITAFLSVFRIMSDIDSSSANSLHATISPQPNNCHSQNTAIRSVVSNPSFNSPSQHHQQQQQQSHTSRIPLAPINSQQAHSISQSSISTSQNLNLSPVDLLSSSTRTSPTRSYGERPIPSTKHHQPTSSLPENYALPITTSNPLSTSTSSQTQMAVAVPAWIKAVRNADGKKQDSDTDSPPSQAGKPNSNEYYTSREGSIDQSHPSYQQYQQQQQALSSSLMSHSFSAPGPISSTGTDPTNRIASGASTRPAMSTSIKSFGSSVVQNLKRAGSLTEWPDHNSPSQSILQRMREGETHPNGIPDSPQSISPPLPQTSDGHESNSLNQKRTWILNAVKKNSLDRANSSTTSNHNSPLNPSLMPVSSPTTSTSVPGRSASRTARYGIYMLKGPSSNSSLSSSSHHLPASSRDSDGQHSANQVLSQATDSEQGDHSQPQSTDQSFPQLPPQRTQFVNTTGNRKNGRRPQTGQAKNAFSDWLSTTSSQAAHKLRQSSTDFGPTHHKSRSVTSTRWQQSTPSSMSSNTFNLNKLGISKPISSSSPSTREEVDPIIRRSSDSLRSSIEGSKRMQAFDRSCVTTPSEDRCYSPLGGRSEECSYENGAHLPQSSSTTSSSIRQIKAKIGGDQGSLQPSRENTTDESKLNWLLNDPSSSPTKSMSQNRPRTHTVGAIGSSSHNNPIMNNLPPSLPVPPARRKAPKPASASSNGHANSSIGSRNKQAPVLGNSSRLELVLSGLPMPSSSNSSIGVPNRPRNNGPTTDSDLNHRQTKKTEFTPPSSSSTTHSHSHSRTHHHLDSGLSTPSRNRVITDALTDGEFGYGGGSGGGGGGSHR
ncbi:hypothetical protein Pst134EA_007353 [Puccinia striiformis f. sp. tritici]|uniref:hypothetical protein n=1 Tax=Puccinia striiformis f. sp. tritici TaxID=168172 RepID=UPI0020075B25|nr:hypothetical protein Pst134EA_007353 [Puccinia striiformis f. sp. tritici]KAH9470085.1 hypothetical protein Pst134EA_007353 [Puccinia striiformis f. sp. tritici]